jgi:NAD(P)-dependent dehydrogenase (short-subunit alcohol dehydrogenase family)
MEGFSESLAHEVKPFGIRVVLIEPGMFRTSIMHKGHWVTGTAGYQEPSAIEVSGWVDAVKAKLGDLDARMGDPSKFGERIVDIVDKQGLGGDHDGYLRVPLSSDAWEMCKQRGGEMVAQSIVTHAIAFSADSGDAR